MRLAPEYPIRTERLLLRPVTLEDTDDLLAYRADPEVCRFVPFEPMTAEIIRQRYEQYWHRTTIEAEGSGLTLGVELAATGRLIGDMLLMFHNAANRGGEIGWMFNPASTGHGYATEAAHATLRLGFEDLGLRRIVARIDSRNDASRRLARRLGMRQEAHLVENELFKGEWTDEIDYAMLAHERPGDIGAKPSSGPPSGA